MVEYIYIDQVEMKARAFQRKKAALSRASDESPGNGESFVLTLDWHILQYRLGINGNCMIAGFYVHINLENGGKED